MLGIKPSYLRKVKQRQKQKEIEERTKAKCDTAISSAPALLTEGRDDTGGRENWGSEFRRLTVSFFKSRTVILSGANT